jgi:hypothetical protein
MHNLKTVSEVFSNLYSVLGKKVFGNWEPPNYDHYGCCHLRFNKKISMI